MSERIAFAAPGPSDEHEQKQLEEACRRVIASNHYILGPEVDAFEEEWTRATGAVGAVGVASGLDALEIPLRALGVGPGDEVIVPAMSAMATALAVARCGATPVFCDIEKDTALIDLEHADAVVTERTRAVIPVHLYGRAVDMPTVVTWGAARGLDIVEDAAQAHGARVGGRAVGTWGDASAFSFYPTKNLGALGDAGAITSTNDSVLRMARSLRNYGQFGLYNHEVVGLNSRLDEMQAAILRARLPLLDQRTASRQSIAQRYFDEIDNTRVQLLRKPDSFNEYVAHLFVVLPESRQDFMSHMSGVGIDCLVHYPRALSDQLAAEFWGASRSDVPVARRHADSCVSIPCRPGLSEEEVNRIISAVNGYTT